MLRSLNLKLALLATYVAGGCHLSDIMSIIGGEYTVDSITAEHVEPADFPVLAIGGKCSHDEKKWGFLFFLEYNVCNVIWSYYYPEMKEGLFDIQSNAAYFLIIGYDSAES